MMSFIKKIFNKEKSDYAHRQFSRFSKGVFENKALVDITVSKDNIKLKTSAEFVNELVVLMANTINGAVHVKGIVFYFTITIIIPTISRVPLTITFSNIRN